MSGKMLILVGLVAASGYALTRQAPPVPPDATAADSARVAHASVGARFEYGLGSLGSRMARNTVNNMIRDTEQSLADLEPGIKKTRGSDGVRAKKFAKKVVQMDSIARVDLAYGRPIRAIKSALEAKSVLNSVRNQVNRRY